MKNPLPAETTSFNLRDGRESPGFFQCGVKHMGGGDWRIYALSYKRGNAIVDGLENYS